MSYYMSDLTVVIFTEFHQERQVWICIKHRWTTGPVLACFTFQTLLEQEMLEHDVYIVRKLMNETWVVSRGQIISSSLCTVVSRDVHYELLSCFSMNQSQGPMSSFSWSITHGSFSAPSMNSSKEIWPGQVTNTMTWKNAPKQYICQSTRSVCVNLLASMLYNRLTVIIFVHQVKYSITDIVDILRNGWVIGLLYLVDDLNRKTERRGVSLHTGHNFPSWYYEINILG